MTLEQIDAFLAIVRYSTFLRASESLFVAGSTLSHRIKCLESELGFALFERGKGVREVRVTSQGQGFIPIAEEWKRLWGEAMELGGSSPLRETLSLSVGHTMASSFMLRVICGMEEWTPKVGLSLRECGTDDSYRRLVDGISDFAFLSYAHDVPGVDVELVGVEQLVFASGVDSPYGDLVDERGLDVEDEVFCPWSQSMTEWHDRWFGAGAKPRLVIESTTLFQQMVRDRPSKTWMLMAKTVADHLEELGMIKISETSGPLPSRMIYLATARMGKVRYHDKMLDVARHAMQTCPGISLVEK